MIERPARRAKSAAPYPWERLEKYPREAVSLLPALRRVLRRAIDERALATALAEVTNDDASVSLRRVEVLAGPALAHPACAALTFETSDGRVQLGVEVDRALCVELVARALGRPRRIADPSLPLETSLLGAASAIVAAVVRRSQGTEAALLPLGPGLPRIETGERYLRVHATVHLGRDAFSALVSLPGTLVKPTATSDEPSANSHLVAMGEVPLGLPVVVATALITESELAGLSIGDAWLPGEGWTVRREGASLVGTVCLRAPSSERGRLGELHADGAVVVGKECVLSEEIEAMSELDGDRDLTVENEFVMDAPLVVRVEMGAVTMTAREWASLSAGDVIALEKRIAEPVSLRIAGIEVARGELVEIEGELGVRIRDKRGEPSSDPR